MTRVLLYVDQSLDVSNNFTFCCIDKYCPLSTYESGVILRHIGLQSVAKFYRNGSNPLSLITFKIFKMLQKKYMLTNIALVPFYNGFNYDQL